MGRVSQSGFSSKVHVSRAWKRSSAFREDAALSLEDAGRGRRLERRSKGAKIGEGDERGGLVGDVLLTGACAATCSIAAPRHSGPGWAQASRCVFSKAHQTVLHVSC
uniref:Uncharacterized protein n=1 Tax=Sphaerodactylus townsendi TaxID=933632 RepID=A0ACB8ENR8_9SAUR